MSLVLKNAYMSRENQQVLSLRLVYFIGTSIMDWESAKKHCTERNWKWSLELIDQAEKEMKELEDKVKKYEDQQKAQRLYNACNY